MISTAQCSVPGCLRIADADGQCTHHMMAGRRQAGLCANCGGTRVRVPVMNDLTGVQLRRGTARDPVWQWHCTSCGRTQRAQL